MRSPQSLPLLLAAVLGVLSALLAVAAVGQVRDLQERHHLEADQRSAVAVATQEVLGLTSLRPQELDTQLEQLAQPLTGAFAQQFHAMADSFTEVVRKYRVTSTGKVLSAGLTSLQDGKAEVLVAATARVTGHGHRKPVERSYRFRVSLAHTDAAWRVSGMELVA